MQWHPQLLGLISLWPRLQYQCFPSLSSPLVFPVYGDHPSHLTSMRSIPLCPIYKWDLVAFVFALGFNTMISPLLTQRTGIGSFQCLVSTLILLGLCVWVSLNVHIHLSTYDLPSPIDHLGCFYISFIENSAAIKMGSWYVSDILISLPLNMCPMVRWMLILFLGLLVHFPSWLTNFCFTNNKQESPFLPIFVSSCSVFLIIGILIILYYSSLIFPWWLVIRRHFSCIY